MDASRKAVDRVQLTQSSITYQEWINIHNHRLRSLTLGHSDVILQINVPFILCPTFELFALWLQVDRCRRRPIGRHQVGEHSHIDWAVTVGGQQLILGFAQDC